MNFETVEGPMIPRYKRGKRGMNLTVKRDLLVKASFESKQKLDGDSRAFTSGSFPFGPLDRLADCGIVPLRVKVTEI